MARPGAVMNRTRADEVSIQALWPAKAASLTPVSTFASRSSVVGAGAAAVVGAAAAEGAGAVGSAGAAAGSVALAPPALGSCPFPLETSSRDNNNPLLMKN